MTRYETKRETRRLIIAIMGTIGILVFLGVFGLRILIGFSLFIDKIRGTTPTPTPFQSFILPPELDIPYEATNSSTIKISGRGIPKYTIYLYVNDDEVRKELVKDDSTFTFTKVFLKDGTNSISAKQIDDKGNASDITSVYTLTSKTSKPNLTITSPTNNSTINGDKNIVTIVGKTDENINLTANGRFVVVDNNGAFSYDYPMSDGDNVIKFEAKDTAGNTTAVEWKLIYHR